MLNTIADFGIFGELDDSFFDELTEVLNHGAIVIHKDDGDTESSDDEEDFKIHPNGAYFFLNYFKKYSRFLKYFVNDLVWMIGTKSSRNLNEFLQLCVHEKVDHLIDWNFFLTNYGLSSDARIAVPYLLENRPDLVKNSLWLQVNVMNKKEGDESDSTQLFDLSSFKLSENMILNSLFIRIWMNYERFDLISSALEEKSIAELKIYLVFKEIILNVNDLPHSKIDTLCELFEQHIESNCFIEIWKVIYRGNHANPSALEKFKLEKSEVCKRMFLWNIAKSKESHLEFFLEFCMDERMGKSRVELLKFFSELSLKKGSKVARLIGEFLSHHLVSENILKGLIKDNVEAAESILRTCHASENTALWESYQNWIIEWNIFRPEYLQWPNNPDPILAKLQDCTFENCQSIFIENKEYYQYTFNNCLFDFILYMFDKFNNVDFIKRIAQILDYNIYGFCENESHIEKFQKICSAIADYSDPNIIQRVYLQKRQSNHLSKEMVLEGLDFLKSLNIDQSFSWGSLNMSFNRFLESFRYLLDEGCAIICQPEVSSVDISHYLWLLTNCCDKFAHYDLNYTLAHLINFSLHVYRLGQLGWQEEFQLIILLNKFKPQLQKDFLLMFEGPVTALGLESIFRDHPALLDVSDFDRLVTPNEFFIHLLNEESALLFTKEALWNLKRRAYDGKQGVILRNVFLLAQRFPDLRFDILKTCALLDDKTLCREFYNIFSQLTLDVKTQVLLERLLIRDAAKVEYEKFLENTQKYLWHKNTHRSTIIPLH